jgi:hypothetical protein
MVAQSIHSTSGSTLLRRILRGNCAFSAISGVALIAGTQPIARFLGWELSLAPAIIGGITLLFAASVFRAAGRERIDRGEARLIAVLDTVWVLASAAILFAGWPPLTEGGRWAVGIAALAVADFAALEWYGLSRLR